MSTGKEIKAGFAKASTWATAVEIGQDDVLLITKENISWSREQLLDDSAGQQFHRVADQGLVTCKGKLEAYLRYEGLEVMLAMAMGSAANPVAKGDTGWEHTFNLAPSTEGLFGTLAVLKTQAVHEFPSVKVGGMTLEAQAGQAFKLTFDLLCNDRNILTTSGTNTISHMNSLSTPAPRLRVLFSQARILMNDAAAGELSASDAIHPGSFSLYFSRGLEPEYLAGGNDRIAEPVESSFPELKLSLRLPSYSTNAFLEALGEGGLKKMMIECVGPEIESGVNYTFRLIMPSVLITKAETPVEGPGKIPHPIDATLLAPDSPRAGMEAVSAPLCIQLINTRSTNPLG